MKHTLAVIVTLTFGLFFSLLPIVTQFEAEGAGYYEGKTIKIVEGRRPGGTGSLRTTITVKHLKKYLRFSAAVFQYMPGGGGMGAGNHVATAARRDGLTIGNSSSGMLARAIHGHRGVRYKLEDLVLLGAGSPGGATVLSIRPGLKIDSVEKLKAYKGLRFANRSVGHSMYNRDRITAFVLGLKDPRWILGYSSGEIRLALGRGEGDAAFGGIAGLLRDSPQWITEGYGFPIVLTDVRGQGSEAYPDFPQGIATVSQYADTKSKKNLLRLHHASTPGGSQFYVHKGIPETAIKELKEAFSKVWKDPEFLKDYELITRQKADPMTGEDYTKIIRERPRDQDTMRLYKQITGGGPLPPSR